MAWRYQIPPPRAVAFAILAWSFPVDCFAGSWSPGRQGPEVARHDQNRMRTFGLEVKGAAMGNRGQWTRWGRGDCEGWSLQIGNAYRGSVVRQPEGLGKPHTWRASINACELGVYPDRDAAMNRVAEIIESEMGSALRDWEFYVGWKNAK